MLVSHDELPTGTELKGSASTSWRNRRSTKRSRRILTVTYLGLWVAWSAVVYVFAGNNGHSDWQAGNKPVYLFVAAVTFWPLALAHWWLTYPADPRDIPWGRGDDD